MVFPVIAALALTGAGAGMNMMGRRSARRAQEEAQRQRQAALDAFNTERDGLSNESTSQYLDLINRMVASPDVARERVAGDQAFRAEQAGPAKTYAEGDPFAAVAAAQAGRTGNLQDKQMAVRDTQNPWAFMAQDATAARGPQALADQLRQALLGHSKERLDTKLGEITPDLNRAYNQQAIGQLLNVGGNAMFSYGANRAPSGGGASFNPNFV
jgi:hypothetical protein